MKIFQGVGRRTLSWFFISLAVAVAVAVSSGPLASASTAAKQAPVSKQATPASNRFVSQYLPYDKYKDAFENHEYIELGDDFAFLKLGEQITDTEQLQIDPWLQLAEGYLPKIGGPVKRIFLRQVVKPKVAYRPKSDKRFEGTYDEVYANEFLETLKKEQQELKSQWLLGSLNRQKIADNLSVIMVQTGVEFAVDLAAKEAEKQIKNLIADHKAPPFYTKKDNKVYKVFVQPASEGNKILFNALSVFGRLSAEEFTKLKANDQCQYEVGKAVVPPSSWKIKLRDSLAYGSAALFESFCDATLSIAMSEDAATGKFVNAKFEKVKVERKGADDDLEPGYRIVDRAKPSLWAGLFGAAAFEVKSAAILGVYYQIKSGVKNKVSSAYRKWFPKYNLNDLLPEKAPLGIANVDGVFRYIYSDALTMQARDEGEPVPSKDEVNGEVKAMMDADVGLREDGPLATASAGA